MPAFDLSVVIPARDAADHLPRQLAALARQATARRFEVILVDDSPSTATRETSVPFLDELELVYVRRTGLGNAGRARNVGASMARSGALLFCDADDEVSEGWVEAMAAGLERAHAVGGFIDTTRLNPLDARRWRGDDAVGLAGWPGFLSYSYAASLGIRADVFDSIGGFSTDLRSGEDVDICWRLQLTGHVLAYVPTAIVHYRLRASLRDAVPQHYRYGFGEAQLYRRFGPLGMTRRATVRLALRQAAWAARDLWHHRNDVRDAGRSALWLARRAGNLAGSVQSGVLYL